MMETLEQFDQQFVLWINGFHNAFLDEFFWLISSRSVWIPLYLFLAYLYYRKTNLFQTVLFVLFAGMCVAIADLVSVHLLKETIMRYRPSHHLELSEQLHFYVLQDGSVYKGGQYGFVSSHAANFAALLLFSYLSLRSYGRWLTVLLILVFILVGLSRIYLGVHYLSDVLVGGFVGLLAAFIVHRLIFSKFSSKSK